MSRFSQKGIDPTVEASEYDAFLDGYENDLRSLPFVRSSVAKKDWALKNDHGQWPGPRQLWDLERSLLLPRPQAHAAYAATGRPQAPEPPGLDGPPLPEAPFRQFMGDERVAGLGGGFGTALAPGRNLLPPTDKQAARRGVPVPPILTVGARVGTDEQLVRWSIIVNDYLRDAALVPTGFGPDAPDPFPDPTSRELFRTRLREERRAYLRIAAILDFIPDFAPPGLGDDDAAPGILAR